MSGTCEQPVLAAKRYATHGAFGGVVVDLDYPSRRKLASKQNDLGRPKDLLKPVRYCGAADGRDFSAMSKNTARGPTCGGSVPRLTITIRTTCSAYHCVVLCGKLTPARLERQSIGVKTGQH